MAGLGLRAFRVCWALLEDRGTAKDDIGGGSLSRTFQPQEFLIQSKERGGAGNPSLRGSLKEHLQRRARSSFRRKETVEFQ